MQADADFKAHVALDAVKGTRTVSERAAVVCVNQIKTFQERQKAASLS